MKTFFILAAVGFLSISGCHGQRETSADPESVAGSFCPQEMCVFMFDRLEEQTQHLRNLEEALRRTVSLLSSISNNSEQFSGANLTTFKADPIILALLNSEQSFSEWEVDPVTTLSSEGWTESATKTNHGLPYCLLFCIILNKTSSSLRSRVSR